MKYARDVMTRSPTCIKESSSMEEAINLFLQHRYRSLPIIDEKQKALGVLTEISLVKAMAMRKQNPEKNLVKDFSAVYSDAIYVKEGAEVKSFLSEVVTRGHARVLVLGMSERLIGIISPRDILRLFSGKVGVDEPATTAKKETPKKVAPVVFDNIYYKAFYTHPEMLVLISNKNELSDINSSFKAFFSYEDRDMPDLELKHLFDEDSYIRLSQELKKADANGSVKDISLGFLKNAKNLIPCTCDIYSLKSQTETNYMIRLQVIN